MSLCWKYHEQLATTLTAAVHSIVNGTRATVPSYIRTVDEIIGGHHRGSFCARVSGTVHARPFYSETRRRLVAFVRNSTIAKVFRFVPENVSRPQYRYANRPTPIVVDVCAGEAFVTFNVFTCKPSFYFTRLSFALRFVIFQAKFDNESSRFR